MPTLASTETFSNGNVLSASALTNHVIDAKPLATFISGQDAVATPAPADEFLIATAGASPAKKVTFTNLAANLPTGTSAASLAVTGATTLTGALTANGNTILGDASTDTLTVNATSSFGSDTTLGTAAVASATWARVTTALTVTKTAHGLTTGNTRYLVFTGTTPVASSILNGTYTVTVTSVDVFTVTVADAGDTVGTVTWYEKTLTLNANLSGPLQGNIPVNVANVEQGTGDEFLVKDVSDSNRLKTTSGAVIKAWANIETHSATVTTYTGSAVRIVTSPTVTITTSSAHGIRTSDVLYIPAVTGFAAGWYSATTVSATVFTVTTSGVTTALTTTVNWYGYTFVGGNIYSVYGNAATPSNVATAVQINFTNKPSASTYCLNLYAQTGSNNSSLTMPVCGIGSGGSTGLNAAFFKTVNGFGVGLLSYDGGQGPVKADSFLNFTALW